MPDVSAEKPKLTAKRGKPPAKEQIEIEIYSCGSQTVKELYAELLRKAVRRI